jgi:hypothetical protein
MYPTFIACTRGHRHQQIGGIVRDLEVECATLDTSSGPDFQATL